MRGGSSQPPSRTRRTGQQTISCPVALDEISRYRQPKAHSLAKSCIKTGCGRLKGLEPPLPLFVGDGGSAVFDDHFHTVRRLAPSRAYGAAFTRTFHSVGQ